MSEIELLRSALESKDGELLVLREELPRTASSTGRRICDCSSAAGYSRLERGIVAGKKAERFQGDDEAQLSMHLLGMLLGPADAPASTDEDEDDLDDALTDALAE